jgi:hypothetical protein
MSWVLPTEVTLAKALLLELTVLYMFGPLQVEKLATQLFHVLA